MSLTYRGVTYNPTVTSHPTPTLPVVGKYRGATVVIHLQTEGPRQWPTHPLTYRGVRYGAPTQPTVPVPLASALA